MHRRRCLRTGRGCSVWGQNAVGVPDVLVFVVVDLHVESSLRKVRKHLSTRGFYPVEQNVHSGSGKRLLHHFVGLVEAVGLGYLVEFVGQAGQHNWLCCRLWSGCCRELSLCFGSRFGRFLDLVQISRPTIARLCSMRFTSW